jgi:hypothetical protein
LVGNNNVTVQFPNRIQCGSGLILIPGGTPTRSGGGKRNVNVPVRILNSGDLTIKSPSTVGLPPSGRVVLVPGGEPASKIIPQNADSLRAGTNEWVWLVGSSTMVPVGDSTSARTLTIRLDSPVTSAQVVFNQEAFRFTAAGWLLLSSNSPKLDSTKVIQRPGTAEVLFRTSVMIQFEDGIPDASKQSFFTQQGFTVLGVTEAGTFYVTVPDPGSSFSAFAAMIDNLRATAEVRLVVPLYFSGFDIKIDGRFPNDSLKRNSWVYPQGPSDSLWAFRAVRAPEAWGCETGTYGSLVSPRVAILEVAHQANHPEFASSQPQPWVPPEDTLWRTMTPADYAHGIRHASGVTGILTAEGNNSKGIAGMAWRTGAHLIPIATAGRRRVLPLGWPELRGIIRARSPRVLNITADPRLPSGMPLADRRDYADQMAGEWRRLLDDVPGMLVVISAGNDALNSTTVANYIADTLSTLLRSGLLRLRDSAPQYASRMIVVSATSPGGVLWAGSNVFTDALDIAAPGQGVLTVDTSIVNQPTGLVLFTGTSAATPLVSGVAALLWSMAPNLLPGEVKDYILRGAAYERYDSTTGTLSVPPTVQGYAFRQLDAYGALQLLSKERQGTPICGYLVSSRGKYVAFHKNGPLAAPTDSVRVPGVAGAVNMVSVARGGRRIAVYANSDSGAGFGPSVITFTHLGQRLTHQSGVGTRIFLDNGVADIREYVTGQGMVQEVTLGEGLSGYIPQLTLPNSNPLNAWIYNINVSPDARFVSYSGSQLGVGSVYVKRFSDQVTTSVFQCSDVCGIIEPAWRHNGRELLVSTDKPNPDSTHTGNLYSFSVDSTLSGGFVPRQTVTLVNRTVGGYGYSYTGDDAALLACEFDYTIGSGLRVIRPASNLGISNPPQVSTPCHGDDRRMGNVVAKQP